MHLGWIDDDGSPVRSERPFRQGALHDHALARKAPDLAPRGFRSPHLDRILTLKRVGVGTVLVIRDCANRSVEDQQVHHLGTIATSDTLVVGRAWERTLNKRPVSETAAGR